MCTDDSVWSVCNVACLRDWVKKREKEYPGIGNIYVEWNLTLEESIFDKVNNILNELYDINSSDDNTWESERNKTFNTIVKGLLEVRSEAIFDSNTLLLLGSADPNEDTEELCMQGVNALNNKSIADSFAKDLGYN